MFLLTDLVKLREWKHEDLGYRSDKVGGLKYPDILLRLEYGDHSDWPKEA
jgi:hypothetical protein